MNIGILLRTPFQSLVERIHSDLAAKGFEDVRPAHGNVFQFIGKNGARITTMAEKAQMTKQSMSYLVEYLEDRGYVERKQDPNDKRAVIFCMTAKGWRATKVAEQSIQDLQNEWREKLGAKKFDTLVNSLEELTELTKS
jgi:DNA-binding MarR family transcriptional regulator